MLSWLLVTTVFLSVSPGAVAETVTEPEDTTDITLTEIEYQGIIPVITRGRDNRTVLSPLMMRNLPSFGGNADVMRVLQTMPLVSTSSDISSGISVMGCGSQNNFYSIDNSRVINPFRFLGFFSTYNPLHFSAYRFYPVSDKAYHPDCIGAILEASTTSASPATVNGAVSAGLINSSGTVIVPIGKSRNSWIRVSGRVSYIDKIYPGLLKFGHASVLYDFNDLNLTAGHRLSNGGVLKFNAFISNDHLRIKDRHYDINGLISWRNGLLGASYSDSLQAHSLSFASFDNRFNLSEDNTSLRLPSSLYEYNYDGQIRISRFVVGANVIFRDVRRQYNPKTELSRAHFRNQAAELSVSGDYRTEISRFELGGGIRLTYYSVPGLSHLYPQPRMYVSYHFDSRSTLSLRLSRTMQFSHLVEESKTGLPCNFFINADSRFKPQESRTASLGFENRITAIPAYWSITAYCRSLRNITEFGGNILNIINSDYDPIDDLYSGRGYSYGVAMTISATFGRVDGWITYNLSRSRLKIPELRRDWFPASFDRTHDLKASILYRLSDAWSVSSTVTYATGLPFTEAEYGYLLGENLLCHYYPHNSSRLPAYFRLDLGAAWRIGRSGRCAHRLDFSVLNCTCHHNVLMMTYHYSGLKGFSIAKTVLSVPIPSISYTIEF